MHVVNVTNITDQILPRILHVEMRLLEGKSFFTGHCFSFAAFKHTFSSCPLTVQLFCGLSPSWVLFFLATLLNTVLTVLDTLSHYIWFHFFVSYTQDLQAILSTAYEYDIGTPCTKCDVRRSCHIHLNPMKN